MSRIAAFLQYRRQRMRSAWQLAGMGAMLAEALRYAGWCAIAIGLAMAAVDSADAISKHADNRVAGRLEQQAAEIAELRKLLAACLSDGDRPIWIGDELYLCGAAKTGVRR